ncbi:TSC22 domain family protein 1 isoform X3 [Talpa occidentalis]|uniref:TSC22 domain family protein 1 isoform X3 n=1 Tax=Talpa occidentalis TaxID=50954 RepID=UPI0023F8ECD0|nr:TSC22 domain family protein 1 isoform X3 [Talpa occidentalis]
MHQPPESTAAAAAADISARKMAHPAMFPRRGSAGGSASALSAAGTGVGSSNATSSEDFPAPSLLQPPPPAASSTSGPQPPPPQSLNLLSQAQLQAQPLAPGGTQMKKKSGFQITSVTPAQISASISSNNSIAEDTESYDDLDESHTEDLSSSEILDVSLSRATDLGEPERSSSEETLNNFQEAETPGAVSPNQPHLPQPHLPHLPQQNVVINGNAHPHHLHHHHHIHHGHHLHHGHHHPSHAGVASASIPGGPPSSPVSRKLSTTGSSDSVISAAPTSAVSSGGSPASVMTNVRSPNVTGSIGISSVTGTNTVNNNITAVGSFSPNVTSSVLGNANINAGNIPSAASVSVGPVVSSGVNVNILSGMGNGTVSSSAVNSVPNAAAGIAVGSASSQQQQPTVNTSRFRVVKLDSSSEPFKKGRWTCTEFYEKENAVPATEGVVINKVVETVRQNPVDVTSERESTSGSSVSSSVSTLSHYTESVGSGEMGAPNVVVQQQQPALPGVALQQMDFSSTGPQSISVVSIPQSISQSQISQVQLQSQELSYQQKQGLQPVPLQATINAATGIQPSPVNVVGVTSALGQQPSISSLAQPQLPYSQTAPPVQTSHPGVPPQQLQYGQQPPTVPTQMTGGHGKSVTQNPTSEYVQQPILQTAVSTGQPSSAGVGAGTTVIPLAQPQSIQLPVQPTAVQAQPAGASGQPVGQAQTAVSAVPAGSQIANIGQQASIPIAVQQSSTQVTPSVIQQGAPPSSQIVPPAQTAIIHQGVPTSASSLPQQLVVAPQSTLLTVPPQPQGAESVAQGVVSQQLPAVSPLPSASSISVSNQVSSTGPSGMPSVPTNLVPPQNIAQTPATQNGNLVQSVSQPPLIATNINLPLAQQIPLSSTQFSAQSLAQAIGSQIEDARRSTEPSLVGLPQTISGDSGGMSAVSDGSSSSLAASASLFPLKVLPLTTPLVDGEDESASLLPEVQGVILEPQIQPRPRRAFDVRGPLSPLNPWRQNIQLLERVGKDNKQISFNW